MFLRSPDALFFCHENLMFELNNAWNNLVGSVILGKFGRANNFINIALAKRFCLAVIPAFPLHLPPILGCVFYFSTSL